MHPKHESQHPGLPEGYSGRAAEADELRAVYELILACDLAEYGAADIVEEELRADWEDPDTDRWVVVAPRGEMAGYGSLSRPARRDPEGLPARLDVECYVGPDHSGKSVGRYLLRLAEAGALEWLAAEPGQAGAFLTNTVNGANAAARRLLEEEGYAPVRQFLLAEIDLLVTPPAPEPPSGVTVYPCVSEGEERAALEAVEDAFRDHWGYRAGGTLAGWSRRRCLGGAGPGLWLTAKAGDEVAGAVFCDLGEEDHGEVEWLAVRRPWRRRGVGLVLLCAAFSEIRARGGRVARLTVDSESPTGAGRLYERAGMRFVRHYAVHRKELNRAAG